MSGTENHARSFSPGQNDRTLNETGPLTELSKR